MLCNHGIEVTQYLSRSDIWIPGSTFLNDKRFKVCTKLALKYGISHGSHLLPNTSG